MAANLSYEDLDGLAADLKVYDVDENGWEHEGKGYIFNLKHVLEELNRARRKDFYNPAVVRRDVAPATMHHALRIARWTEFGSGLAHPSASVDAEIESLVSEQGRIMRTESVRIAAYATGEILLSDFLHRLDHPSEAEAAYQSRTETLPKVSQALMLFALDSAAAFDFDPGVAFKDKLASLREKNPMIQPTPTAAA